RAAAVPQSAGSDDLPHRRPARARGRHEDAGRRDLPCGHGRAAALFRGDRARPPRDLGRHEAHRLPRGHHPRVSYRFAGFHAGAAADRVPGRPPRRADPGRLGCRSHDRPRRVTPGLSERALILAPHGRDSLVAAEMLPETGIATTECRNIPALIAALDAGAGFALVTEEGLVSPDLRMLADWLDRQPEWSDFPFVLLTMRGGGIERNPAARRHLEALGNVTFLERPFHPTTLVSLAQAALRGRRRQYEARARMIELRENEA